MKNIIILIMLLCSSFLDAGQSAAVPAPAEGAGTITSANKNQATSDSSSNVHKIDAIRVVLYSDEGTDIITQSDIDRPGIDGTFKTLDDIILERLMYMDAKRFKILPDEESVDKHLKAVQRENNLTLDQLKAIFKAAGYTYEEGREQFAMMTTINSLLDFRIRSRLLVPEKDVMAYYTNNPQVAPAEYFLERAVVAAAPSQKERLERDLCDYAATGKSSFAIEWSTPFWIAEKDMAEDKKALVMALTPGQISAPIAIPQGFEIFKLVNKKPERTVPLEERYREISMILRKPRYETLMADYKKLLLNNASIVYL